MREKTIASVVAGIAMVAVLALVIGGAPISVERRHGDKSQRLDHLPRMRQAGINILEQAMRAAVLLAANVPQEAVYWKTAMDGAGQKERPE